MVRRVTKVNILIPCACGCGDKIFKYDYRWRERTHSKGHYHKGKKLAENNPMWIGDKVTRRALHRWIRYRLPIPDLCEFCKLVTPVHLANVTGIYNRDFENWKYLCVLCHNRYDQRFKMKETRNRKCLICGSDKTYIDKHGWLQWRKYKDGWICRRCHDKHVRRKR